MKVSNKISIGWDELSSRERERLFKALSFLNGNQELYTCYRYVQNVKIEIPRGAWHLVEHLDYNDSRARPKCGKLKYVVELDRTDLDPRFAGQSECVATMLEKEQGLVIRAPGTGKTQIALAFAAQCQTSVLVLVHTKDILDQWIQYASRALPGTNIGVIQGRTENIEQVTIGMVQTLNRFYADGRHDDEWWRQFGAVILDEAHHGAARSFEAVMNHAPSYYRFGFTATDKRADGMHPYLVHLIGPVIHRQNFSAPIKTSIKPVYTKFDFWYRGGHDWATLLNALIADKRRNRKIARIIDRESERGNSVLVLSRRIEHLERIAACCTAKTDILTAARGRDNRKRILKGFRNGRISAVLATQLADEALDVPRCNRLILAYPGKHDGRITQQVGRVIRKFEGKSDAIIYDVVDKRVGVLKRQWQARKHAYRAMKIPIRKHRRRNG